VRADKVVLRDIDWLWMPYLQRRALNLMTGDPGVGKSTIVCEIVARLTRGQALPGGVALPPMNCWMMNGEDANDDTTAWRLRNQGADMARVRLTDKRETMTPQMVARIGKEVRTHGIEFLSIDPLQAWMGKDIDMNRANETREWSSYLRDLAMIENVAVLICRHRRKALPGENRLYSGIGSIDITGLARSEISAMQHPKTKETWLQRIKGNVGKNPDGVQYLIEPHPDPKNPHGVLKWLGVYTPAPATVSRTPAKLKECIEWVKVRLAAGPVPVTDVVRDAAHEGFSFRTLERAKVGLVKSTQVTKGEWIWELLSSETPPGDPIPPPTV